MCQYLIEVEVNREQGNESCEDEVIGKRRLYVRRIASRKSINHKVGQCHFESIESFYIPHSLSTKNNIMPFWLKLWEANF